MRKLLNTVNVMLGTAIMSLIGSCKSQNIPVSHPDEQIAEEEPIMCKYGVPPSVLRQWEQEQEQANDSVPTAEIPDSVIDE